MKPNLFYSLQLLVIIAVSPMLAHSQTQTICSGDPTPAGWITISTGPVCFTNGFVSYYLRTIEYIQCKPVGTTLQICGFEPVPSGWITTATGGKCATVGIATLFLRTILRITANPNSKTYYQDADGDGFGNPGASIEACTPPAGYVTNKTDCDDSRSTVHPGATEVCNGLDDNCNGKIDEALLKTFYRDADDDTYGDANNSIQACATPPGYVTTKTDCDDSKAAVHPGAIEILNGIDDNCNGKIDDGTMKTFYPDADGDGFGNSAVSIKATSAPPGYVTDNTDCDDSKAAVHPGAVEVCDGADNNCNGKIDDGAQSVFYHDVDNDGYGNASDTIRACSAPAGYVADKTDCNDSPAGGGIHPAAPELCDGLDNNCNGQVDEGVQGVLYRDADNDGYGNSSDTVHSCLTTPGYVINNTDCNDSKATVYPGAVELCDGLDNNCNGQIDEGAQSVFYRDADKDGYGNVSDTVHRCSAPAGYVNNNTDCNDGKASVHPGAVEVINGVDDNCDGIIDNTTIVLEAEDAVFNGAIRAAAQPGYIGSGYIDFINNTGDFIEWTFGNSVPGTYTLKFRYANGGNSNRRLLLQINGVVVNAALDFLPTGGWATWKVSSLNIDLTAGVYKIRLTTIGYNGPNIDNLVIERIGCKQPTITPAGNITICSGVPYTLIANSGAGITYQWLKNGNPVPGATSQKLAVTSSGNYSVIEKVAATGCNDTSAITAVSVITSPPVSITPQGNLNICQAKSMVLQANSGTGLTYQWKKDNSDITGATSIQYTANSAGLYYVLVTNGNGCRSISAGVKVIDSCSPCSNVAPVVQWQKSLGGSGVDEGNSIQQTRDGGFITAGVSVSNNGDVTGNHGNADYWIVQLNSLGDISWQKSLGGSGYDQANSIHQTNDGGFIVAGYSSSNDGDVSGNHGGYDYWIVKLNSSGNIVWQKSLGGTADDVATWIGQTTDGGFIVAGYSYSNDGDVTGNHGSHDYWIVKLDPSGAIAWQKSFGGSSGEVATSVEQTIDGGFIVAGYSSSNNGNVSGNHGLDDYWIIRLDAFRNITWQKSFGGSSTDITKSIRQTKDGGFIVAGYSHSNDGDVTGNHSNTSFSDYWVVKFDASGNLTWQKSLGGSAGDVATSIEQTSDDGFIVAGYSQSNDGDVTGNHGLADDWIVKLNASGKIMWQKCFGGSDDDLPFSIHQARDGGFIISGYTSSSNGDVSFNHGGPWDFWIVKLGCTESPGKLEAEEAALNGAIVASSVPGYTGSGYADYQNASGDYIEWIVYSPVAGPYSLQFRYANGGATIRSLQLLVNGSVATASLDFVSTGSWTNWSVLSASVNLITGTNKVRLTTIGYNGPNVDHLVVNKISVCSSVAKQWDKDFGGNGDDFLQYASIQRTADGGYISGGFTNSGISGDKTQNSQGANDYWIVKTDANGIKQWDKRFGGTGDEYFTCLQQTTDGGYILGGHSMSNTSGDKTQDSRGSWDYWVVKTDANGNKQWDKTFGGNQAETMTSLQQTSDGGYIFAGYSSSDIGGDKTQGTQGINDYWVIKTDGNGVKQWDKRFGGNDDDNIFGIQQTSDGGYILGGWSISVLSSDKTQGSQGSADYWIVKITGNGTKEWDKTFGGNGNDYLYSAIKQTNDGGYILGGYSNSGISGDKTQAGQGGYDYWIVKTDGNGVKQWDKTVGGTGDDQLWSIQQTSDGGFVFAGESTSGISGDKTQNTQGGYDYWIVKTSSVGTKQWDIDLGGGSNDFLYGVQQTTDGYILGGVSNSGISGDKTQASQGGYDYWIVKIGCNGTTPACNSIAKEWDADFGGDANDMLSSLQQTYNQGYILGGTSFSGISGDKTNESRGGQDFWMVKTDVAGKKQWDARFGGSGADPFQSLQQTSDGGYILGGYSNSGISGDKTQDIQGEVDYWIVKTDSNGVKQWDKDFGGSLSDVLVKVLQTPDGGYILGGYSNSGIGGDKTQPGWGGDDYWVIKTDSKGLKQWDKRFGGSENDVLQSIRRTSDGGYILGGNSFSGVGGDKTQPSQGSADYWIVKIDSNGLKQWDKRFGGFLGDGVRDIQQTVDGGYILGGYSLSGISGDKTQGNWDALNSTHDFWILKTDSHGDKQWDARFGGAGSDVFSSLQPSSDGGYILCGNSASGISGDKTQSSQGSDDFWIVKIDNNGIKKWDYRYGGKDHEEPTSLSQTSDGGLILGGYSISGKGGDKTQANFAGYDFWVIKLGCSAQATGIQNVLARKPTSVSGPLAALSSRLSLYPNPSIGIFSLKYQSSVTGKIQLTVYDLLGRQLFNRTEWAVKGINYYQLNLSKLSSDNYFIEVNNAGEKKRSKFLIQK